MQVATYVRTHCKFRLHLAALCVWILTLQLLVASPEALDGNLSVSNLHDLKHGVMKEDVLTLYYVHVKIKL